MQYPVLFADVAPSNFTYKVIGLNLQIMVMDIVKKDLSNENDVISDTLQIIEDVIIELRNPSEIFLIQDSINLTPFSDSQGDEVSGWTANITINIPSTYNSCAVPSN
jgi:TolB-like protein